MSASAPAPAATTPPPSNSSSPPPATPPPLPPAAPPPTTPPVTPSPPPVTPSSPPPVPVPVPVVPSSPPPTTPSLPPPAPVKPSSPPPVTPVTPSPPATPTTPPVTPSTPPATPSTLPPVTPGTPSSPPPSTVTPPPSTPSVPNTPPGTVPSPPSPALPSPSPPSPPSESPSSTTSIIVGVAVGGVLCLLILGVVGFCCWRRKRQRLPESYGAPPPYKVDPYGRQYQNWQRNDPPPFDHVVNMATSLPSRPTELPPPVPEVNISSGGSGSNYSGGDHRLLPPPSPGLALGFSKSTFTYEELRMATDGFSDANLLGQGGFGYVHRGVLPNGKEVAVKQLKVGSGQGEREFQAEVEIISRVHHKHLVSLVGYCMSEGQRLLVYEFVPNNTMEFHLHGKGRPTMEWRTRMKIALGAAKGLAYLHEDCHPKIIHRDIKASNILVDYKFEAKVADFGLAKLTNDNNTHVSTRVMGTFGYLAPEYASSGKLTEKSDVFSFGVMLLELITGRRPVDVTQMYMDDSLVDWARPLLTRALEEGDYKALVDPRLGLEYNANEMARMVACAAASVRHSARRRPKMSQVVRALEGDVSLEDLNEGVRPGHSRFFGSYGSSEYDSSQYNDDMKKFQKMALTSENYPSGLASESGQAISESSGEDRSRRTEEIEMGKSDKR